MKKILLAVAVLALLMGCLGPPAPGEEAQLRLGTLFQMWVGVAVILLILSLMIMLLAYIFGNILANERIKAWAKIELFEIIYSIIILAFVLYGTHAADSVVQSLMVGNDPYTACICSDGFYPADIPGTIYYNIEECHIRMAIYFLHTIFSESSEANLDIYLSYIITATIADAQLTMENVMEPAGMITFTPWRGFLSLGNVIKSDIFDKYIIVMLLTMFQEILVRFIATAVYPVLFVTGVVLRAFTFTRRLGGLLMALALSLFFIYPMFYAFGGLIVNQIKFHSATSSEPDPPIAYRLYIRGSVPFIAIRDPGGGLGELDVVEEKQAALGIIHDDRGEACDLLRVYRSLPEGVQQSSAQTVLPAINIHREEDTTTSAFNETVAGVKSKTDEFREIVSKRKWYDFRIAKMFQDGGEIDILARLMFFSVFFGLLGILGTIAAIKNLSILLGGETEIAGLTHLI